MPSFAKHLPVLVISLGIFISFTGIFSLYLSRHRPLVLSESVVVPLTSINLPVPDISAKYVLVKDLVNSEILFSKQADVPVPPASTTKMMTALVAVSEYGWDRPITVQNRFTDGSVAGFKPGEQYSVEQLVYSLLVKSANDAAEILASAHPQGRDGFIASMNQTAVKMGLTSTHFANPSGLDEDYHYSSASDITRLGEVLVNLPLFSRIVAAETVSIIDQASHSGRLIQNSNPLLGKVPGVLGIKTGFTDNAGESLITLVDRGGRRIIVTVLGSRNRAEDSRQLIEWAYSNFNWN